MFLTTLVQQNKAHVVLWSRGFAVPLNEDEVATRWVGHVARRHTFLVGNTEDLGIDGMMIILKRILYK
jgi:hypothetical protein